jgi:hypothetical protein
VVGPWTRAAAPAYRLRELDPVRVEGKRQPVAIDELLGGPDGDIVTASPDAGTWRWLRFVMVTSASRDGTARPLPPPTPVTRSSRSTAAARRPR